MLKETRHPAILNPATWMAQSIDVAPAGCSI